MNKSPKDTINRVMDVLTNAESDPSEALSILLSCIGNISYDIGIDVERLEEGVMSIIQSIYAQRENANNGVFYDTERLRSDMMRSSLGAAISANIPEAMESAFRIQNMADKELIPMAKSLGIDIKKYQINAKRKKRGRRKPDDTD